MAGELIEELAGLDRPDVDVEVVETTSGDNFARGVDGDCVDASFRPDSVAPSD